MIGVYLMNITRRLNDIQKAFIVEYNGLLPKGYVLSLDDAQVITLVTEMRRVSSQQVHFIDEKPNAIFYNRKTLAEWESQFNWPNNKTTLISVETNQVINT